MFPALTQMGFGDLKLGRGHFENCIRPFETHQKLVQMTPNTISDIFQAINYFSYGLDVEIRPKLTPGAGTQVQYSTALWLHGHGHVLVVIQKMLQCKWITKWITSCKFTRKSLASCSARELEN